MLQTSNQPRLQDSPDEKLRAVGRDQELEGGFPHPRAVGGLEWVPRKVLLSHPLPRLPFSWLMAEAQRFPSASQLRTVWEPPHTHQRGTPLPTHNEKRRTAVASWAASPEPAADKGGGQVP